MRHSVNVIHCYNGSFPGAKTVDLNNIYAVGYVYHAINVVSGVIAPEKINWR